jgi:hypothetical protein
MHESAEVLGRLFFELYWRPGFCRILDIGSLNVNGSLRPHCPIGAEYIGIDVTSGAGVDVVVHDPYHYPFPDDYFDLIVSTSCFEHDPMFWLTFLEAIRVLSPRGFFYINAPSNGLYHSYPMDHWRFYPDASMALVQWAERSSRSTSLIESFIAGRSGGDSTDDLAKMWNDYVMVFTKGNTPPPPKLICDAIPIRYNVRKAGQADVSTRQDHSEDARIILAQRRQITQLQLSYRQSIYNNRRVPRLTIFCVAYRRYEAIPILIHSMMCQTFKDFKLVVIHDGEDDRMKEILTSFALRYPESFTFIFTRERHNDYGHSLRQIGVELCESEFYMSTNDDNYYVPVFLEEMFKKADSEALDLILCDMVHSHNHPGGRPQGSYNAFATEPRTNAVDIGCFIVKTKLAKAVGFRDKSFGGDGTFVDDIMGSGRPVKWGKIDKILLVHN